MGKNGQKYGMHGVCTWCVSARRTPARCPHKPHPDCLISSFLTAGLTFHVNSTNELFAQCGGFFRDWITNKPSLWRACVSSCIIVHYNLWTMEKKVHEHFRSTGSPGGLPEWRQQVCLFLAAKGAWYLLWVSSVSVRSTIFRPQTTRIHP